MSVFVAAAVALLGSVFFALGAALQQFEAVSAPDAGLTRSLVLLLRRPRWLIGGAAIAFGGALHIVALSLGPLTVVQPMGVASMLFALPIATALRGRTIARGELAAALAVSAGLVGLVLLVPEPAGAPAPRLSDAGAAGLLLGAAAVALVCRLASATAAPALRSGLMAAGAGILYGATASLIRVTVAEGFDRPWLLLAVLPPALAALAMLQGAYATGHFPVAYASVQMADPLTAVACGALLLGEPLPRDGAAAVLAVAAAAVAAAGIAVLARSSPLLPNDHPPARRDRRSCPRTCADHPLPSSSQESSWSPPCPAPPTPGPPTARRAGY
ncbi:DMT family transporter [Thermopolyspora sp. NPDC052614]|uniref:DMT family transporter n=1 Tax=Thermopolyspora sp. NPDC052614 TaxID=3155682 RepID=UPI0034493B89